jgi:hypothetical protein
VAGAPGGVRITGLREKVRDLQALGVEVADLKGAFGAIAAEGATEAKGFVPVLTGTLSASIRGNKAKNKAVVTAGRARVPYAGAINYGWPARNIPGDGFMQDADQVMQPKAEARLDEELTKVIRERGLDR